VTDCNATALLPAVHVGVASLLMLFALQTELLQLCDSFWEDGELSIEEVYNLAKWLNENREACFEWPGNALVKPLQEIWADGEVDLEELRRMAWLLRDIQTTWVRRQIPKQRVYQLKPRTHGAALPLLDFQCEVTSHSDPDTSYQINLTNPKCTCPDWQTRRYKLPDGHLSKCCKHIFGAYQQAEIDEAFEPWLLAFINDANPPHPLSNWFIGEVQGKTFLASTAPKGWSNVFAMADGDYDRFGFNVSERRWAYGIAPYDKDAYEEIIIRNNR